VRRMLAQLGAWIDSESVRPYQAAIYALYAIAGAWAAWTGLPSPVDEALGRTAGLGWVGVLIGAPALTFTGRLVGLIAGGQWSRHVASLTLQLAGDAGVMFASFTFSAALASTIYAGRAVFAGWVVFGLGICALGLVVRGVRKLTAGARIARTAVVHARDDLGD
jgi:hypothetical protein